MGRILECGCECNMGPTEKEAVELMRLKTPPYEILRVIAAAVDNNRSYLERLERLIYTVKERGEEVLVPRKLTELVDDIGVYTTGMHGEYAEAMDAELSAIKEETGRKLNEAALEGKVAELGLVSEGEMAAAISETKEELTEAMGLKLDADALDGKVGEFLTNGGYVTSESLDEAVVNVLTSGGYVTGSDVDNMISEALNSDEVIDQITERVKADIGSSGGEIS